MNTASLFRQAPIRVILLIPVLLAFNLLAQPGSLDYSFNPNDIGFGNGSGFSSGTFDQVTVIRQQPDGRLLIGGTFTAYNGTQTNTIVSLTADGIVVGSFQSGSGLSGIIHAIEIDGIGGWLIGGSLSQYNGSAIGHLARLNSDGSLDASFPNGTGPNGAVRAMVKQPDGKLINGGSFTSVNGTPRARIARLESDGSLDLSFDPGTGADADVYAIALRPDGSVLIGGSFTNVNGTARVRMAQLMPSGAVDPLFDPGAGANALVKRVEILDDGRVIIIGDFTSIGGVIRGQIARLSASGTLDATFGYVGPQAGNILSMALMPDGKVMVGGSFLGLNGVLRNRIARLDQNGIVDPTFDPGVGFVGWVLSIHRIPDGRLLCGGSFLSYSGVWRKKVTRIMDTGVLDLSFNPGSGASGAVSTMVEQPDGRVLIGGRFSHYNGEVRLRIARIHEDGSLDGTFDTGLALTNENDAVNVIAVQPDGRILVGGNFLKWSGATHGRIVRLLSDGSIDPTFTTGTGANSSIYGIAVQPDGKILIAGFFTAYNGTTASRIARLNADGSIDPTFNSGTGFGGSIYIMVLLSDGRILASGAFTSFNGTTINRIARLNADGSLDNTFIPGSGASSTINTMAVQADGKILIGGQFTSYSGYSRPRVARLLPDGGIDTGFIVGTGASGGLDCILPTPGGQVYIGGYFTSYNGASANSLARLMPDGSLDNTFSAGTGTGTNINPLALLLRGEVSIARRWELRTLQRHWSQPHRAGTCCSFADRSAPGFFGRSFQLREHDHG